MVKITIWKDTVTDFVSLIRDVNKFVKQNPTILQGLDDATETEVSSIQTDGVNAAVGTNFSSAASDFVTDTVAAGDYVWIIVSPGTPENLGRWRIESVTDLNTLVLDADLTVDTGMSFTIEQNKMVQMDNDIHIDII